MQLFAPSLAIVDLETTGTHAGRDRITEVGVVDRFRKTGAHGRVGQRTGEEPPRGR